MSLPDRKTMREKVKEANKQLNQELQTERLEHQSFQREMEKDYGSVPHHQRITSLTNDVNESNHEQEYTDFILQKELKAVDWTMAWDDRVAKLGAKVASLQVEAQKANMNKENKALIDEILKLSAKIPAINQALSDHFHHAPAQQWQSAMDEIQVAMDELRPQLVATVLNKANEDIAKEWPHFVEKQLGPLRDANDEQEETIKQLRERNTTIEAELRDLLNRQELAKDVAVREALDKERATHQQMLNKERESTGGH